MKGMDLAKAYFADYGQAMIDSELAAYKSQMACGLVGEGSECFGYDDAFSTDHDFGPGFCIWVPEAVYQEAGAQMQRAYEALPRTYLGYQRLATAQAGHRVGIWSIERFYRQFTGLDHPPKDNIEWFKIPASFLATATNGEVFWDAPGIFSNWRNVLLGFYPEDVVKKKLAAKCARMAQAGQYNYGRSLRRGDRYAAYLACHDFITEALAAIYLINERYAPYYKWLFRGAEKSSIMKESVETLKMLTQIPDDLAHLAEKEALIESVCVALVAALNHRGWTRSTEAFLQVQAEALMRAINDSRLRQLPIMTDVQ